MKSLRTRAIVLRRTNYGEADRIIQFLTPTGKRSVMARGVRREKSRLSGGIELFGLCEIVVGEGKGELGILTSSRLVKFYGHIMEDYDRMQFGYDAIKLVTKASETVDEPEWYDILAEVLAGLDVASVDLQLVKSWFYIKYSALIGYELSLWHDVSGDKLLETKMYRYDVAERGLRLVEGGEIQAEHIKLLRLIATRPLSTLAQIGGIQSVIGDCLMLAQQHAAI
jgi:DNA repair protein RecO (recombination protein O)